MLRFLWRGIRSVFGRNRINRDNLIFFYSDGTRTRSADPVEIERKLIELLGEDWRGLVASIRNPINPLLIGEDLDRVKASRNEVDARIRKAVCYAFDVEPFKDGVGLLDPELRHLFSLYNLYCLGLVELSRPFANVQSRDSPTPASSPIASGADSTSPAT